AMLTRVFGVHNLALAEDVVQDAFCRALEVWKFRGVPDNPSSVPIEPIEFSVLSGGHPLPYPCQGLMAMGHVCTAQSLRVSEKCSAQNKISTALCDTSSP